MLRHATLFGREVFNTAAKEAIQEAISNAATSVSQISQVTNVRDVPITCVYSLLTSRNAELAFA